MKWNFLVILVLVLLLTSGCSPKPIVPASPAPVSIPTAIPTPTPTTNIPTLSLTYESSAYGVKIKYPQDWTKQEGTTGTVVQFFAPKESASATQAALTITVQDLSAQSLSLDAYTQRITSQLRQTITDFNLIESSATTLAGSPAHKVVYTGKQGQRNPKVFRVWTIVNNKGYIITYAANPSNYSDFLGIIQQMIDSFSISTATPTSTPTPTPTVPAQPALPSADPVKIDSGLVSGTVEGEVHVYKGIPFAAPPVGDLRWRPPQPVTKWAGVRVSTQFGPVSPQNPARAGMSEDSLYLNVYTPAKNTSERLPVMVFLHGGGSLVGAGSNHDGNALARQGVVVVTTNYRLGPLGWLAHPLLSQESQNKVSGNYGLLDQVASLQWVKTNIAAFGGDPGNVTVFGESAGASAIMSLMASPLTTGLFHRAIAMSGGGRNTTLKEAEKQGESFAAQLGVSGAPDVLKALRAKSADELVAASTPYAGLGPSAGNFPASPVVDGWFLLDTPLNVFGAGKQQDVPLIVGANAGDDAKYFSATKTIASGMNEVESKAYVYVFTRVPPGWSKAGKSAIHRLQSYYLFGNLDEIDVFGSKFAQVANSEVDPVVDGRVSQDLMALWVRFAATGNPNIEGKISWPSYDPASEQYLDIKDPLQVKSGFSGLIK